MLNEQAKGNLKKALAALEADQLGAMNDRASQCVYHNTDYSRYCLIGSMFTPEVHQRIDDLDLNEYGLDDLFEALEVECEDVIGLTTLQALTLQSWHDDWQRMHLYAVPTELFSALLQGLIDGSITHVSQTPGAGGFTNEPVPGIDYVTF